MLEFNQGTGVVGDSMSINETMALLHLCKMIIALRHASEEITGQNPYGDAVADVIPGSDAPTPTFVSKDLVETLSHNQADMASIIHLLGPPVKTIKVLPM